VKTPTAEALAAAAMLLHVTPAELAQALQTISKPTAGPRKLFSVAQVAEAWNVHEMTVLRALKSGRLAGRKFGRQWRISAEDVEAFAAAEGGTL